MPTVPATGRADWTDYADYWREMDAEWLMKRSIVRYATEAERSSAATGYPAPETGMVSYLDSANRLDLFTATKWVPVLAAQNLIVSPVTSGDNAEVTIGHKKMAGGGISFVSDGNVANDLISATRPFQMGGGVVRGDTTGLTIKTGAASAKLTTSATQLVSSIPINVAGTSNFVNVNITGSTVINDATITINTLTITDLLTISEISLGQMSSASGDRAARKDYVDAQVATRLTQAAADVRYLNASGDTLKNGMLYINGPSATLRVCSANNAPYIDFHTANFASQLGYIQCTTANMNIVTDGDILMNSGGGQVRTSDALYASGGLRGFRNGPCLIAIGTAANVYQEWYGAGSSLDSAGPRYGWQGFNASGHYQLVNECSEASIFFRTAYAIILQVNGEIGRFVRGVGLIMGKSTTSLSTEGSVFWYNGTWYSSTTTGNAANAYLNTINKQHGERWIWFGRYEQWIGSVYQNGSSGTVFATTCDYRVKTIVGPIRNAVDRLMKLRPYRVTWNGDPDRGETDDFMAHEVAEVVPDAVVGVKDAVDKDGKPVHQQMGESKLITLTVAALQEIVGRVAALERNLSIAPAA